jgi:branched-chain amino acid transport system ATP-binding protein
MSQPLLEVREVTAGFGPTTVLHGLSYAVAEGEIAGIFGLNGAGKSVSMKVLAGIVPARSGRVLFRGEDITGLTAEQRVRRGIAHVPQGRQVFASQTVAENLRLGAYTLRRRDRSRYDAVLAGVYDRFPLLAERRNQVAGTMSGGQQASLAVARALMSEPALICVDEPSAGLAPLAVAELLETLQGVARTGVTMVLVEQNVSFGLRLAATAHILQTGRVVHSAPVAELDPDALARHLGVGRLLSTGVAASVETRRPPRKRAPRSTTTSRPAKPRAPRAPRAKKAVSGDE